MRARVFIEKGRATPGVCYLEPRQPLLSLGRSRSNQIVLQDVHASRKHAELYYSEGRWYLRDCETRNGTRLNGDVIAAAVPLVNGQVIEIGETRLRFSVEKEPGDEDTPHHAKLGEALNNKSNPPSSGSGITSPAGSGSSISDPLLQTPFRVDELSALCSFMTTAVEEADPHELILRALQMIQSQTLATLVGFLNLDQESPLPKLVVPDNASVDIHLSRQLTQNVQATGEPVWLRAESPPLESSDSLAPFADAICVPLRIDGGQAIGAVHAYRSNAHFRQRDLRFCEIVAGYLAQSLRTLRARRTLEAENSRLRGSPKVADQLVGDSPALKQLRQLIARAAPRPSTVLIEGESGVGKELVALSLHKQSTRSEGPLVVLNCAAMSPTLVEAELFGYRKGAFTGADRDHPGLFQQADDGTLFLDEIGELPLDLQSKLLRIIEGKGFRPVGGISEIRADVRVIAATNRDLQKEVKAGRFREDLYFRLRVIHIPVPPLRDRAHDIPALVEHFLTKLSIECRRHLRLTPAALRRLQEYSWPGNIRQLRAALEGALALSDSDTIDVDGLPLPTDTPAVTAGLPTSLNLEEIEGWAIRQALRRTEGNVTQASKILGIVRDTLSSKMKKLGIDKHDPGGENAT